jgi:hypothetical protein
LARKITQGTPIGRGKDHVGHERIRHAGDRQRGGRIPGRPAERGIAGKITTDSEPLGRVRLALDKIRFGDGPDAFRRQYLVKLPTTQPYPNFVRWTDHESIARAAAQQQEAGK